MSHLSHLLCVTMLNARTASSSSVPLLFIAYGHHHKPGLQSSPEDG